MQYTAFPAADSSLLQPLFLFHLRNPFAYVAPVRSQLPKNPRRLVIKLGTGVLTNEEKQPDPAQMNRLVAQVAEQVASGREVVLVTSGAVGSGMGALGYERRPKSVAEQQACAAVGQSRLMATYDRLFARFNLTVAQVLLTHADLQNKERHRNASNTLLALLARGVVPIINENDAVSTTELKFGDNDRLSALVAALLPADLLIILTTVDGVIEHFGKPNARTLSTIERIDEAVERLAGGTVSTTAVGGMKSKVQAAKVVVRSGIPLVIASGRKPGVIAAVMNGEDEGTLFVPEPRRLPAHKRWIAFFHRPSGQLYLDAGAEAAVRRDRRSLLHPGVVRCEGAFGKGEIVSICDSRGTEFARGVSCYSAEQIVARDFIRAEVVHRDHLVVL